jgi:hypothetical protein
LYRTAAENGSSGVFGTRTTAAATVFAARFRSLVRGVGKVPDRLSESSLICAVSGGVGGSWDFMVTLRTRETAMVASAAISRASTAHRGFVVNTTKNGTEVCREKVCGQGRVTYKFCW